MGKGCRDEDWGFMVGKGEGDCFCANRCSSGPVE